MDLSDPVTFGRIYDEHRRGVHATAHRVLGSSAAAQDVVQDVFLRVWRNPQKFDAHVWMPKLDLNDGDIQKLTGYLTTLKQGGAK